MEEVKEIKQPLGLYDVFGYILPGFFFIILFIVDLDGTKIIEYMNRSKNSSLKYSEVEKSFKINYLNHFVFDNSQHSFGIISLIILLIICYIIGHVLSAFSSFANKHFVKHYLNHPSHNLLNENFEKINHKHLICRFFDINNWQFSQPLDENIQKSITKKLNKIYAFNVSLNDKYWLVYTYISTQHNYLTRRISHFVNLSGFTRNICGTTIFYIIVRLTILWPIFKFQLSCSTVFVLVLYVIIGVIFFWSYLRIHRRQAYDMFYIFLSVDINKKSDSNSTDSETKQD